MLFLAANGLAVQRLCQIRYRRLIIVIKVIYILSVLVLLLSVLNSRIQLKTLRWKKYEIRLSEAGGGATVGFEWRITLKDTTQFCSSEELIFRSYINPTIDDILIRNDSLIIISANKNGYPALIPVSLNQINELFYKPIKYFRAQLDQTNKNYVEPEFIRNLR